MVAKPPLHRAAVVGGSLSGPVTEGLHLGIWSMDGLKHGHTQGWDGLECSVRAVLLLQLSQHLVVGK